MNKFTTIIVFVFTLVLISCGGSDDGPETPPPSPTPEAASLILPLKNEECNQGNVISSTSSKVKFEWNASLNTDKYTLVIKNLSTQKTDEFNASSTSSTQTLSRGVSYSWKVISKSNSSTSTSTSETWNFYNAGNPVTNYSPFPAEVVSPKIGGLTSTLVTLKWNGSDLDNDIENYDVYLDTSNPPTKLIETTTSNSINDLSLSQDIVYYWSIVTKDKHGNSSQSPIFDFRTQ